MSSEPQQRVTRIPKLPQLSWSSENAGQSLQQVYEHVRDDALGAANWYHEARRSKRLMAYSMRVLALTLAGAAAIFPLLIQVFRAEAQISGVWASIMLTVAGGAVAFDRALGYTTGWVRYMKTELQIRHALELFELEWESQRAMWIDRPPTCAQVTEMLQRAREFTHQINSLVNNETTAWLEEFQSSLKQLDDLVRGRAQEAKEAAQLGNVSLTVSNGNDVDDRWTLNVEGQQERLCKGKTAVITNLAPGVHVISVSGNIGGVAKHAEAPASVPAGGVVAVEVTLG